MTPEERAEKIVYVWNAVGFSDKSDGLKVLIQNIAAQIREAVEEADRKRIIATCQHHAIEPEVFGCPLCRCAQTKSEAYADAATTMAEGKRIYSDSKFIVALLDSLESRFRARAAEVSK